MENLENVPENTKLLFVYRQNSFYDKINESLKEKYKGEVYSITLPKETENLNEFGSSRLLKIIEDAKSNKNAKLLLDETIPQILGEGNIGDYKSMRGVMEDAVRQINSPESYISVLEKIAQRSKDVGVENILISLIGLYQGKTFGGGWDIDCHGLIIKDKEGNEIDSPIYSGKIQETFDFLKIPFEKYGFDVIPAMYDYSRGKKIVPLENCGFETSEREILKIPPAKELDTKNSAILADRHQELNKYLFKRIFHKHENASIEEISKEGNSTYYYPFNSDDKESVEKIIEEIGSYFK